MLPSPLALCTKQGSKQCQVEELLRLQQPQGLCMVTCKACYPRCRPQVQGMHAQQPEAANPSKAGLRVLGTSILGHGVASVRARTTEAESTAHAGEAIMTQEVIEHVASLVEQKGSDAWWGAPMEALLPPSLQDRADQLQRGDDTMDVCGPQLLWGWSYQRTECSLGPEC